MTGIERGRERGIEKGRRVERLETLEALLETQFSPLPPGFMDRVRQLPDERLRQLALAIPRAKSLADLGVRARRLIRFFARSAVLDLSQALCVLTPSAPTSSFARCC